MQKGQIATVTFSYMPDIFGTLSKGKDSIELDIDVALENTVICDLNFYGITLLYCGTSPSVE